MTNGFINGAVVKVGKHSLCYTTWACWELSCCSAHMTDSGPRVSLTVGWSSNSHLLSGEARAGVSSEPASGGPVLVPGATACRDSLWLQEPRKEGSERAC